MNDTYLPHAAQICDYSIVNKLGLITDDKTVTGIVKNSDALAGNERCQHWSCVIIIIQVYSHWRAMDDASIGVVGSSSFKSTVIGGQWMTPALELWDHHHSSLLSLEGNG